jgi:hypothetical protein
VTGHSLSRTSEEKKEIETVLVDAEAEVGLTPSLEKEKESEVEVEEKKGEEIIKEDFFTALRERKLKSIDFWKSAMKDQK